MREVNFSIPNVNKASVGITTALYDRRALDCTSTLPLINSLNHLAYLTTSSARIRDILTVDGGVERLVCILKQGRSQEMMEIWKWNLAFQCVVNIGVRGSEAVRTRVVEADMVPVIATILDNYVKVVDMCRELDDADTRRRELQLRQREQQEQQRHITASPPRNPCGPMEFQPFQDRGNVSRDTQSFRRHNPPALIEIPQPFPQMMYQQTAAESSLADLNAAQAATTSPQPRPNRHHHHHHHHNNHHHHHRSQDSRHHAQLSPVIGGRSHFPQPIAVPVAPMDAADGFGIRPVRDADRLPSMLPSLQAGITSQPDSPTTPNAPMGRHPAGPVRNRRRSSVRHQQQSGSGDSDDAIGEEIASEASAANDNLDEPMVDVQATVDIQGVEDQDTMADTMATPLGLTAQNVSEGQEAETFNITHRSPIDGSIINTNIAPTAPNIGFPPAPPPMNVVNVQPPPAAFVPQNFHTRYLLHHSAPPGIQAAMPRDEDVLMSLQLLAYVSKYCTLRSYFQESHLVPKLRIDPKLKMNESPQRPDGTAAAARERPGFDEEEEEYLLPDDFNIFPLVEKFTVRHHSQDMRHWAGVVMRNLCRKDDSRGGIRQCAYYRCGKWEEYTRQFAKCRRCRRTKYCSKECQKKAWVFHRHWCVVASQ
ncbi:MAG: hypothetical protein LQ338_000611 [Usnochroma carphineum]|nr:MAG: hypothetical protein LQ338_000611 [Usnochroma carphineum]